jgi:hypothetical protein
LCPRNASPAAKAAAVVVLPTPPLPDVMTTTFAKTPPLAALSSNRRPLPGLAIFRRGKTAAQL